MFYLMHGKIYEGSSCWRNKDLMAGHFPSKFFTSHHLILVAWTLKIIAEFCVEVCTLENFVEGIEVWIIFQFPKVSL